MRDSIRKRVRQLFLSVADLPDEQREAVLAKACAGDPALRTEVEALLAADRDAGGFLANPTAGATAEPVAPAAPDGERAGDSIDRYKLLEKIGEGGMGTVWMAEQREPVKRRVALKIIKLGMDTRQVIARFEAERQALALMDHPGIAKVFDAGATEAGRPYFVMEYIKGIPVLEYCDLEKLDTKARLQLFVQVCRAIQHAHQKGIIHRDIKPDNVLVTLHDGVPVPKVIDFGIAKATNAELTTKTLFTEHRQFVGTPAYMSPEQAEMSGLDIDTRSDVYSLGVLLYEILTGTTPFDVRQLLESGLAEMMRTIREVEPHKPSTRISTLGKTASLTAQKRHVDIKRLGLLLRGDLDWIVMKCLEKDRSRRYETAHGLAADIDRHLHDEPVTAAAPSTAYKVRKFVRRNRGQTIAAAAVALSLLVGVAAFAWQAQEAGRQEAEARRQAEVAQAVADFQTEMLAAADPHRLLGDRVTVLQAIQGAVGRLEGGAFRRQPEVEVALRLTIGNTLLSLGSYDAAESNLRRAVELLEEAGPGPRRDVAFARQCLAAALLHQQRLEEAEQAARQAVADAKGMLPPHHPTNAIARNMLAGVLRAQHRLDEAEELLRESLELREASFGPQDPSTAQSLNNLATLLLERNELEQAVSVLRRSLEIFRSTQPAGHPSIATALNNLSQVLQRQGKFAEAEALQREALELRQTTFPDGHPAVAQSLQNLATALAEQGALDEAIRLTREAVAIHLATFPEGHASLAMSLGNLGEFLRQQNQLEDAEAALREALEIARSVHPANHPDLAMRTSTLGMVLEQRQQVEAAERLHREALAISRAAYPGQHPSVVKELVQLGQLLRRRQRTDEATALLEEALGMARACLPADHPGLVPVLRALAHVCLQQRDLVRAEALLREALGVAREALDPDHPEIASTAKALGVVLSRTGRLDEAVDLHRTALAIERSRLTPDHLDLAHTLAGLGSLLLRLDRRSAAEPLLEEALGIAQAAFPPEHPELVTFLGALGSLRNAQGRHEEAESLLRGALRTARRAHPGGHPEMTAALANLGALLGHHDRFDEAEPLLREALDIDRRIHPAGHPEIAVSSANLAWALLRQGQQAEAESLARESLAIRRAAFPAEHPEVVLALHNLGVVLLTGGARLEEAEALLREALRLKPPSQSPDHPNPVDTQTRLVQAQVARAWQLLEGVPEEGGGVAEAACALAEQAVTATDGGEIAPHQAFAEALFNRGMRDAAIARMERALELWQGAGIDEREGLGERDADWMQARIDRYRG